MVAWYEMWPAIFGFRPAFTYLRISGCHLGEFRVTHFVIFFVCGVTSSGTTTTTNYVKQLIKLGEGKNSLCVSYGFKEGVVARCGNKYGGCHG
jgi:hypothetical protein